MLPNGQGKSTGDCDSAPLSSLPYNSVCGHLKTPLPPQSWELVFLNGFFYLFGFLALELVYKTVPQIFSFPLKI